MYLTLITHISHLIFVVSRFSGLTAIVSGLTIFVLIGFFVAICIKKRSGEDKSGGLGGHYNGE